MVDEKQWYRSKTIWGALLAVGSAVIGALGITIDAAAQAEIADAMVQLVGALGAIVAIYGRLSATEIIS